MLLYATTVRLGMLLKKRRMVWSAKCLEPQSKTLFMATVLSCTQQSAKRLMGQGFAMHEKTLTFVSRLAFFYILVRLW